MQTVETIKELVVPIAKNYGVKRVYLFGSYAKGDATERSDVDIMIEKGTPLSLLGLSGMRMDVEEALGLPVDIVTTVALESDLMEDILGTEILLYEER